MAESKNDQRPVRKLSVKNFSVIKEAELDFGKITVLIGPQASGKSLLCKLAYFLRYEVLGIAVNAVTARQPWEQLDLLVGNGFYEWFPSESWSIGKFKIHLQFDRYSVQLDGEAPGDGTHLLKLRYSSDFKNSYLSLLTQSATPRSGLAPDSFEAAAFGEFNRLQDKSEVTSPLFVPAGRAFFVNSDVGFAATKNPGLDPLVRRFAVEVVWNPNKWKPGMLVSWRMVPESISREMDRIAGGAVVIRGNEPFFKTGDDRVLALPLLSSGTQELLPLFNVLNRLVYIHEHSEIHFRSRQTEETSDRARPIRPLLFLEEPEAHVFPRTQFELVRLFSWLANDSTLSFNWVITTHSPYILTAFNTLIEAWRVGHKHGKYDQVAALIPEQYWVNENEFAAYTIRDGVLISIFEKEQEGKEGSGLIDGDYLDAVSDELGGQFDKLLDIEYAQ
jgi:predicted ATPase